MKRRTALRLAGGIVLAGMMFAALCAYMFAEASRMPLQREVTIALPGLPQGSKPIRVAFLADTHMSGPESSMERLNAIVDAVNAQQPDIILLGGDYGSERKKFGPVFTVEQGVMPFARLRARWGVYAVLGNHDVYKDYSLRYRAIFAQIGVKVLLNGTAMAGPVMIGGIGDAYSGRALPAPVIAALLHFTGPKLLLTHSPDIFPALPSVAPPLLAAHTHCGQIALPFFGAIYVPSRYGRRYACGIYREQGKIMLVSGGIGSTKVPFRLNAPPEYWIVDLVPERGVRAIATVKE